jgi:Acetyltransferase (GNAT) domain
MIAEQITNAERLAELADDWERLVPDAPMLGPRWLLPWWRHYGAEPFAGPHGRQLAAIALFDPPYGLVSLAPWYIEETRLHGRAVRFLGMGEVCTDYLGIPCRVGYEVEVARKIADVLLAGRAGSNACRAKATDRWWDMLDLRGVDDNCPVTKRVFGELENRGALVRRGRACNGWRVPLPATWDEYVDHLSKSHRKQVRRMVRGTLASGRLVLHEVRTPNQLPAALAMLASLHRRRRLSMGESDLFARGRFAGFHRDAARGLLAGAKLRLTWAELDGVPVAAEYQLCGSGTVYAYQSGIDPGYLQSEPGHLATIATMKAAIERGDQAFDFMRGDVRVWPGSTADRLRRGIWQTGQSVRAIVRDCRRMAGL